MVWSGYQEWWEWPVLPCCQQTDLCSFQRLLGVRGAGDRPVGCACPGRCPGQWGSVFSSACGQWLELQDRFALRRRLRRCLALLARTLVFLQGQSWPCPGGLTILRCRIDLGFRLPDCPGLQVHSLSRFSEQKCLAYPAESAGRSPLFHFIANPGSPPAGD